MSKIFKWILLIVESIVAFITVITCVACATLAVVWLIRFIQGLASPWGLWL